MSSPYGEDAEEDIDNPSSSEEISLKDALNGEYHRMKNKHHEVRNGD